MWKIRCPHCGNPAKAWANRWECGYCLDCGPISSLRPAQRAMLQAAMEQESICLSIQVKMDTPPERQYSTQELEDMVRRWDFSENEFARIELLLRTFPQAISRWTEEELDQMGIADILIETGEFDPKASVEMMKFLLDAAQPSLQNPQAAQLLRGDDLYDACMDAQIQPLLLQELETNDHLARQLFLSAYSGPPPKDILSACANLGKTELKERLEGYWGENPYNKE